MVNSVKFNFEYTNKVKVGFIGCGSHAYRNVYPTFDYAPIDLVAVCDLQLERAEAYRKRFGAEKAYTDYKEMIKKENLDAVFIVLNFDSNGHPIYPKIIPDLLDADLPVWVEKPISFTAEEGEKLQELEAKSKGFVQVANKRYFFPAYVKAQQIVNNESFGKAISLTAKYPLTLPPYKSDKGREDLKWFLDICHPMSAIQMLMGNVKEMLFTEHQPSGNVHTIFKFQSGAIGTLNLASNQAETSPLERMEVTGEGENVLIDNGMRLVYYTGEKGSGEYGKTANYIGDNPMNGPVIWEPEFSLGQLYSKNLFLQGMVQSVNQFAEAVLENKEIEKSTLSQAVHFTKIFDAYKQRPDQWIEIN